MKNVSKVSGGKVLVKGLNNVIVGANLKGVAELMVDFADKPMTAKLLKTAEALILRCMNTHGYTDAWSYFQESDYCEGVYKDFQEHLKFLFSASDKIELEF